MKRKMLDNLDFLRAGAFFAVVMQHILGAWGRNPAATPRQLALIAAVFEFFRLAVPIFVFLTALLLFYRRFDSYPKYLLKRARTIFLPYALWTAVYILDATHGLAPAVFARDLAMGDGAYHLWYICMQLQFIVLAPILLAAWDFFARRTDTPAKKTVLFVLFAAVCIAWLIFSPRLGAGGGFAEKILVKYRTRMFSSWLVYFGLGAIAGRNVKAFSRFCKKALPVTAALFLAGTAWFSARSLSALRASGSLNFATVSILSPEFTVCGILGILALFGLSLYLVRLRPLRSLAAAVARVSYDGYLSHVFFINLVNYALRYFFPRLYLPAHYVILTILTLAGSLVWGEGVRLLRRVVWPQKQKTARVAG